MIDPQRSKNLPKFAGDLSHWESRFKQLVEPSILFSFLFSSDRPVTYLYNTLHYYEHCLRDKASLKKKLVGAITSEFSICLLV